MIYGITKTAQNGGIPLIFDVCIQPNMVDKRGTIPIISALELLAIAVLIIGIFVVDMQQANADNNNGDSKTSCNDHHHSGDSSCSHKDSTPFILPFP